MYISLFRRWVHCPLPTARCQTHEARPLLRILGVGFGIAVIIGSTIGAGILRTPGAVVAQVGSTPLAFLMWAVGGLYALLGAAALADLATTIPKSGGFYVYARRALGERAGFVVGCADWFSNTAFVAYGAITLGEYAVLLGAGGGQLPAVAAIVGFTRSAALRHARQQPRAGGHELPQGDRVCRIDCGAPCRSSGCRGRARGGFDLGFPGSWLILALQLVIGAYDGWQSAMYFAGEDRQPERNLPRAFIGGVLVVIAVYLLMNVALMRVLPLEMLAASELPAADAAGVVFGERGATLITALSLGSLLSLIIAVLLTSTRILYAMAEDAALPRRLAFVEYRRHAGLRAAAVDRCGARLRDDAHVRQDRGHRGVLRRRQLRQRLRLAAGAAPSRAGTAAAVPVVGIPVDDAAVLAGALIFLGGMVVSAPARAPSRGRPGWSVCGSPIARR